MSRTTPSPGVPGRPRKSPLRVAALPPGARTSRQLPQDGEGGRQPAGLSGDQLREMMTSEFCQWLRSRTNQEKRPFQEETITACKVTARALDAWMTATDTAIRHRPPWMLPLGQPNGWPPTWKRSRRPRRAGRRPGVRDVGV